MSIPITHTEIARAAIKAVQTRRAYDHHMRHTAWNYLDNEDREHADETAYELEQAVSKAQDALDDIVTQFEAQQ